MVYIFVRGTNKSHKRYAKEAAKGTQKKRIRMEDAVGEQVRADTFSEFEVESIDPGNR